MVGKLEQVIENGNLRPAVNQSLIQRARRILNDYSIAYRGFRPTFYASSFDINALLKEIMGLVEFKSYDEAAIIEAEDHEAYLRELCSRIDHIDLFEMVSMRLRASQSLPQVRLDKERFIEAMTDLLERLSGRCAGGLSLSSAMEGNMVAVRISLQRVVCTSNVLEQAELRFFERAFALSGCFIQINGGGDAQTVSIELMPSTFDE